MSEDPPQPYKPTKPFVQIDPRWWSLGVVDGFKARPPQGGVSDQFSYTSGRVEGEAAREQAADRAGLFPLAHRFKLLIQ